MMSTHVARETSWLGGTSGEPQGSGLTVQRWDAGRDGVLTANRLRQRLEDQGLWVSERRYAPAEPQAERTVDHDSVEVVLTGLLKVSFNGEAAILAAGDAAFVPRGVTRRFEVVGSTPVVSFNGAFLPHGPVPGTNGRVRYPSVWR
jgi:quercetin dioxygenase-like cupin family protein